eukprot:Gregarina_sp_Poly_1__1564@NODE_1398_length_4220_cov_58_320732_g545_i1_p3_GENE_NODE_1398_length_4220_cov_58_320732_g545_i1NODE_1398_length_4220_cov_58_320732_g545_i1_p3_ORF_typecomplete_len158_score13_14_NODE_1398_length_4220_cov_58_320732_g545_i15711044
MTGFLPPNLKGNSSGNQNRRDKAKREGLWGGNDRRGKRARLDHFSPFGSLCSSQEDVHFQKYSLPSQLCSCVASAIQVGQEEQLHLVPEETSVWEGAVANDNRSQCSPPTAADSCLGIFDTMLASAPPGSSSAEVDDFHADWYLDEHCRAFSNVSSL